MSRFSYNKVHTDLGPLNFTVQPGGTLGIIGPTGSGKTTVFSLLQRFYDPDEGEILLSGVPLRSLNDALRSRIGVVLQSDFLMAVARLRAPISALAGGREISADSVHQAARTAQADFICKRKTALMPCLRPAAPT